MIIIVVILLVRIDYIIGLYNKLSHKLNRPNQIVNSEELQPLDTPVPINKDPSFVPSKRTLFFNFINDYLLDLSLVSKDKTLEILKSEPSMFSEKLDTELEATILKFKEPLKQKKTEAVTFLITLIPLLKDENSKIVKDVLASYIEIDFEELLRRYAPIGDSNCTIVTHWPDKIEDTEKFVELNQRQELISKMMTNEKTDKLLLPMMSTCQLALKLYVDKLKATLPINIDEEDGKSIPTGEAP